MFGRNKFIWEKMEQFNNEVELPPKELLFKFLVVGDYGVGKTSIVNRYAEGVFSSNYKITIGADFAMKRLDLDENTRVNLQLWDIAGHERFGFLTRVYYKYAVAAAIVFDLSRLETFESVEKWICDLRLKVTSPNGHQLPVILLANKSDVAVTHIPTIKIQMLCQKFNILAWFFTSAKENSNIDEAFWFLVHKASEDRKTEKYNYNENIVLCEQKKEDSADDEKDSLYRISLKYPEYPTNNCVKRIYGYRNNSNIMSVDSKNIGDWTSVDVIQWIMQLYINAGESYERLNLHLLKNCTGSQFLTTTESELRDVDSINSKWLSEKVKELARSNSRMQEININLKPSPTSFENLCGFIQNSDNLQSIRNSSRLEDVSTNEVDLDTPRRRGRPKLKNSVRRNSVPVFKTGKVWEFLRNMLHNPEYCPRLICWVNHDEGVFKFNASDEVAKIWGSKRRNKSMNYEKLSRAMRYYYKKKILEPVYGRRLVYKFGPKAVGWKTNNPNFQQE